MKSYLPPFIASLVYPVLTVGATLATYTAMTAPPKNCPFTIQPLVWENGRHSINVELSRSYQESIGIRCQ
jgi:hypothetical protein